MGRGKPIATALPMSERHGRLLEQESRKRSTAHQNYVRIPILLRAAQGQSNSQISPELGISYTTVLTWLSRWQLSYATLLAYEKGADGSGISDAELLREMVASLQDTPRSGTPKRITLVEEQQLVALACTKPADHGVIYDQLDARDAGPNCRSKRPYRQDISPLCRGDFKKQASYVPIRMSTG